MVDLYRQKVMKHFSYPKNQGIIENASKKFFGSNPLCGDELIIYLKLDKNKKIIDVKWEGDGCAISQAAASIFSEMIKNKSIVQVKKISPEKLIEELEVELSPTRRKCALLPLFTIKEDVK